MKTLPIEMWLKIANPLSATEMRVYALVDRVAAAVARDQPYWRNKLRENQSAYAKLEEREKNALDAVNWQVVFEQANAAARNPIELTQEERSVFNWRQGVMKFYPDFFYEQEKLTLESLAIDWKAECRKVYFGNHLQSELFFLVKVGDVEGIKQLSIDAHDFKEIIFYQDKNGFTVIDWARKSKSKSKAILDALYELWIAAFASTTFAHISKKTYPFIFDRQEALDMVAIANDRQCLWYALEAARYGNLIALDATLRRRPDLLQALNEVQNTLLGTATRNGRIAVVSWLLEKGAAANGVLGQRFTPLYEAVKNIKLLRLLLDNGADPKQTSEMQKTPLHAAAENGSVAAATMLVEHDEGSDLINQPDSRGMTPLMVAVQSGHKEVVAYLINNRAKLDEQTYDSDIKYVDGAPHDNKTAVSIAVEWELIEILDMLLAAGAKPFMVGREINKHSLLPVHIAASKGRIDIVKVLMKYHPDILSMVNINGQPPFVFAPTKQHMHDLAALDPKQVRAAFAHALQHNYDLAMRLLRHGFTPDADLRAEPKMPQDLHAILALIAYIQKCHQEAQAQRNPRSQNLFFSQVFKREAIPVQVRRTAAEKLRAFLLADGEGDFTEEEKQALYEGELGRIYQRCDISIPSCRKLSYF